MGTTSLSPGFFPFHWNPPMPITNLEATTELEAVNALLSAIGEAPVTNIDLSLTDVEMAYNQLRNATREVQNIPWRFNTEFGVALDPVGTLPAPGDPSLTLNVFAPPPNTARAWVTRDALQYNLDLVLRPSKVYGGGGVRVFYDRVHNQDGLDSTKYPRLWVHLVTYFDFEDLPEEARRAALVVATRRFVSQSVGSPTLASFTERDEYLAIRALRRAHGQEEDLNIFDNLDVSRIAGRQHLGPMGTLYDTTVRS